MDKHANIHFDGNKFAVTDRNGKPIRNSIFNRHAQRDAFTNFITNGNTDAGAVLDSLIDAYGCANGNTDAGTYGYGYAAAY
jgi:hypothetical protein